MREDNDDHENENDGDFEDVRWRLLAKDLPSLYLIGPMGAGKTTIGRLLAKQLGRDFVDCDQYIAEQTGADIPWIFAKEGEAGFRERETRALRELTAFSGVVVATGGGAIERDCNRDMLKKGLVIYLSAEVEVQFLRTKKDKNRPLLQNDNPKQALRDLYTKRHPLYMQAADIVVPTGKMYPKQMALEVLQRLALRAAAGNNA